MVNRKNLKQLERCDDEAQKERENLRHHAHVSSAVIRMVHRYVISGTFFTSADRNPFVITSSGLGQRGLLSDSHWLLHGSLDQRFLTYLTEGQTDAHPYIKPTTKTMPRLSAPPKTTAGKINFAGGKKIMKELQRTISFRVYNELTGSGNTFKRKELEAKAEEPFFSDGTVGLAQQLLQRSELMVPLFADVQEFAEGKSCTELKKIYHCQDTKILLSSSP